MKKLIYILFIIPLVLINGQKIGKLANEKPHLNFPDNSLGLDIMIGEGGFGIGGFYRYDFSNQITGFADISVYESKSEREIQRYDYWGYPLPIQGKKNRVFLLPLNFGIMYRLFYTDLTDNLRPFINFGIGPTMIITTPAVEEFFNSFRQAKSHLGVGGYIGLGTNIGNNIGSLTGVSIRYYITQVVNGGIEQFEGDFKKSLQQVTLTINIGIMY